MKISARLHALWLAWALAACSRNAPPPPLEPPPLKARPPAPASAVEQTTRAEQAAPRCPKTAYLRGGAELASKELDEISGVVESHAQPGTFWVHNDSGDDARVFAIDARGATLLEVRLEGVEARDFEDIALLPRSGGPDLLLVADTGNNLHLHATVALYAFSAPRVGEAPHRVTVPVRKIEVRYEDGSHDVETLLADPRTGDVYLVEKGSLFAPRQKVAVYRIAAEQLGEAKTTARRVATVALGPTTGGDFLPDGSGLAIRNYSRAMFWSRSEGESVAAALTREGCELPLADRQEQGESFAFTRDGKRYLTIAEGVRAPLHFTSFALE